MQDSYKNWLIQQQYSGATQSAQLHRVSRIESLYGSLDDVIARNEIEKLIEELSYSAADARAGKPNPSKIPFDGDILSNLRSYKDAVVRYSRFVSSEPIGSLEPPAIQTNADVVRLVEDEKQKLSLERDMQRALRHNIGQLEDGLRVVDDGAERGVSSGFIDILCEDTSGNSVVVELKAGKTDARVVGQILGYMGDLLIEDERTQVRGIIVAHEFDKRTVAASKAVPNLNLVRYSIAFRFELEG